ncbi:MAG: transporter substrate-binding domain-containing protein [Alphaproteobacteria bacterium]
MRGCLIVIFLALASIAHAQDTGHTYIVGTKSAPPFAMKAADGTWDGVSIALWNQLADRLGITFEYRETDLDGMISNVESGAFDLSIAAMSMSPAREQRVDFSHPYFRTALGVAVRANDHSPIAATLAALTSATFLRTLGMLLGLLFVIGIIIWLVERRHNSTQFEPEPHRGLFSGFWWAAVTMATVGYGDKAPVTVIGRLIGIVWMFAALFLTAVFTANLAASLTTARLTGVIDSVASLSSVRVGVLQGSASETAMTNLGVVTDGFATVKDGFAALLDHKIDAFVQDQPILIWSAAHVAGVEVTPIKFNAQSYAIVLPTSSPLIEPLNRALLDEMAKPEWQAIQTRFLGPDYIE